MKQSYEVHVDDDAFSIVLEDDSIEVNGQRYQIDMTFPGEGHLSLLLDGAVSYSYVTGESPAHPLLHVKPGNPFQINVDGHTHDVLVEDQRSLLLKTLRKSQSGPTGPTVVTAPMPGLVAKILVKEGEQVLFGQGILILEAMKMENEIKCPQPGIVQEIRVRTGQPVEKGEVMARISNQNI